MAEDRVMQSLLLDFYGELLTDKQREAVEFYYNEDLSLGEIAENQNISRQGVRDAIARGAKTLADMENKLHLISRDRRAAELIRGIRPEQLAEYPCLTFEQGGTESFYFNEETLANAENLRIINGSGKSHLTGNDTIPFYNLYTKNMYAGTWKEYPVVADVNGDGEVNSLDGSLIFFFCVCKVLDSFQIFFHALI